MNLIISISQLIIFISHTTYILYNLLIIKYIYNKVTGVITTKKQLR